MPVGAVVGALAFTAYYYFVMRLEQGFNMLSKISLPPEVVFSMRTMIALLPFGIFLRDFSKLRPESLCVMFVFIVSIAQSWKIDFMLFFFTTLNINLQLAYGQSFASLRWFFRIFVAVFCTKAISYFFGIVSWYPIFFLTIVTGRLYTLIDSWIHSYANNAVMIRENFRVRYFQRGTAKAQMKFVKRRLQVFLFILGVTVLSTFGHVYPWLAFDYGSETTANVFCKIDNTVQLECNVKTAYNDPYSESQGCKNVSQEWDYCGALVVDSK